MGDDEQEPAERMMLEPWDLTATNLGRLAGQTIEVAVLPTAAIEAHNRHLPEGQDSIIRTTWRKPAAARPGNAALRSPFMFKRTVRLCANGHDHAAWSRRGKRVGSRRGIDYSQGPNVDCGRVDHEKETVHHETNHLADAAGPAGGGGLERDGGAGQGPGQNPGRADHPRRAPADGRARPLARRRPGAGAGGQTRDDRK